MVYDLIDRDHTLCVLNKILTICVLTDEGLTDRAAELRKKNPTGWYIYYVNRSKYTEFSLLKLKYLSHYLRFRPLVAEEYRREYSLPVFPAVLGIPGALVLALLGKR